ncbi:MAG: hypothetical protein ABIP39_10180 [Polyangiaceae bacterium]
MLKKTIFAVASSTLVVIASSVSACSSTSTAAPIAEADLAVQAAHALCDSIQPCCAQVGYTYDGETCIAAEKAEVQQELTKESGRGGTYDANAAGACVAQLRAQAAACADPPAGSRMKDCGPIYVGTKKVGDACAHTAECAANPEGSVSCSITTVIGGPGTGTTDTGICVLYKTVAAKGDPCGGSSSGKTPSIQADCESNSSPFYCDYSGTHTCVDRIAIGQTCHGSDCVIGAFCNNGKCAAQLAEGATCTYGNCATGLYCNVASVDTGTGTCAKEKSAGEPCVSGLNDSCGSGSCSMGKCSAGSLATANACKGDLGGSSTVDAGTGDGG